MACTFSAAGDAAKAVSNSEVEKLHVKGGGAEAGDGGTCSPLSVDLGAVQPAADQPLVLLLRTGAGGAWKQGARSTEIMLLEAKIRLLTQEPADGLTGPL